LQGNSLYITLSISNGLLSTLIALLGYSGLISKATYLIIFDLSMMNGLILKYPYFSGVEALPNMI